MYVVYPSYQIENNPKKLNYIQKYTDVIVELTKKLCIWNCVHASLCAINNKYQGAPAAPFHVVT